MNIKRLISHRNLGLMMMAVCLAATGASAQANSNKISHGSCIAIANPTVSGAPGSIADASNGVRELISSYLAGPTIKALALESKLPSQAREEAKAKGCEPVLFVTVTKKTVNKHGFLKALTQGAAQSSWRLPSGGSVVAQTANAGAAAGLQAASTMAANTKAKDEVHLEYRLESASGQVQFGPKTETQTASVDGEDLLTPVVARAAESILEHKSGQ